MKLSSLALGLLLRGSSTHASAFTLPSSAPPTSALIRTATNVNARRITSLSTSIRGGSTTTQRNMADRPFETWTFDGPCGAMDWTPSPSVALTAGPAGDGDVDDADLVIVGVFAPKKEDGDDESDDKEVDPIEFAGAAKDLDEKLGGALTELAADNSKAFQNGGSAGSGE